MKAGSCWGAGASWLSELGPKSLIRMNLSCAWAPDIIKTLVILLLFIIQTKVFFWFVTEHISNQLEQICLYWWPRTASYSMSQNVRDENMRRQGRRDLRQTWASFLPVVLGLFKTVSFFFFSYHQKPTFSLDGFPLLTSGEEGSSNSQARGVIESRAFVISDWREVPPMMLAIQPLFSLPGPNLCVKRANTDP